MINRVPAPLKTLTVRQALQVFKKGQRLKIRKDNTGRMVLSFN